MAMLFRALAYIITIIVLVVVVTYLNGVYNPPQPQVTMSFNALSQAGTGYVNNTLSFPIVVDRIYCTRPNGQKFEFQNVQNNTVNPGSNTFITIAGSKNQTLPSDCDRWGVIYTRGAYQQPSNGPVVVQTGSNTVVISGNGIHH